MIIVYLTCANSGEAEKISTVLLEKKLVACAKKLPIESKFWWEGKLDTANEVLVSYETVAEKFEDVKREVVSLHSYDIPMIYSIEVFETTEGVKNWLKEELG